MVTPVLVESSRAPHKKNQFGTLESRIEPVRAPDAVLAELVAERRKQVEGLQKRQFEQLAEAESRGQERLKALRNSLGKDVAHVLQEIEARASEDAKASEASIKQIRSRLLAPASTSILESQSALTYPQVASFAATWVAPYYGTLHGSDGAVYWQGYNPVNIDLSDWASGSGSGLFGTGAGSFTVYMDWWFNFRTDVSRFYSQAIYVPFHGYYIVQSDDGFWDSKEAHVRMDLSAMGYQYNGKPTTVVNVFDEDSQNINVNDRFDGWRTMNYSDLLGGGDTAYLLVSSSFYVYARGGGSYAELNFAIGSANYIGQPLVYVS